MAGFTVEVTTTSSPETVDLSEVTVSGQTYNATVYWGDTSSDTITAYNDPDLSHSYATAGTYEIEIQGQWDGWSTGGSGNILTQLTSVVDWGDAVDFDGFAYLASGFRGCSNLTSLPSGSILMSGATNFTFLFLSCTGLTSVPSDIFDNCTSVTVFLGCFFGCSGISAIPSGLFDNCTSATTFNGCFQGCSGITGSIPSGLFDNCTVVTSFENCYNGCSGITGSIPSGLFDNCTAVTTFNGCFRSCSGVTAIPSGLFDNCTVVTSFYRCFYRCTNLSLSSWMFYPDGEQSTKFLNRTVTFEECFDLSSFTGAQGTAPDLWNCDFGTGTATKTNCFNGHSSSSVDNYKNIPVAWGGSSVSAPTFVSVSDSVVFDGQTNVGFVMTDALPYQGTGKLELVDNAVYGSGTIFVEQTIGFWTDAAINATIVRGALPIGPVYAFLTTDRDDITATPESMTCNVRAYAWIQRADGSISAAPHEVMLV